MKDNKHEHYELLNLIGYGLSKFGIQFVHLFNCKTKASFYQHIVDLKIVETVGTVKNRQDLFDPFFDNNRKGWWQKWDAYIHRKILIDSLFGALDVCQFAGVVKLYIDKTLGNESKAGDVSPIIKSKFKQLQITGREAELYFINNYKSVTPFSIGMLEDARLFGDGYDFQIQVDETYYLVEVKGVRESSGNVRMTENEYLKAKEYKEEYGLAVISNLSDLPKMSVVFNPAVNLHLTKKVSTQSAITYHSEFLNW